MNPNVSPTQESHSLDVVIRMTGSSRRKILLYCRHGLLAPTAEADGWYFDEEGVMRLRHIETLRQRHRMNWAAIRTIMNLLDEVEVLREELRFRR